MGWFSRTAQSIRGRAKKTTRSVFRRLEPVRAYVTGGLTAVATFINPALGAGVAGLRGLEARYIGATVARDEGLSGHAAREAGRRQREKELKAAGIGGAAGALTAVAIGSPWTGSGLFGAANPNAAAEATMAAYDAAGGPAAHGAFQVAPGPVNLLSGEGTRFAVQAAGEAYNASAEATMAAYDLAGGPAAHGVSQVAASGGGFFSNLFTGAADLLKTGGNFLPLANQLLTSQLPPGTPGPIVDLAGAVLGGGAGGQASEPDSVSDAFAPRAWSTGAKLAAAAGVAAGGFILYRLTKKKAA